jgi:hypothetical protein
MKPISLGFLSEIFRKNNNIRISYRISQCWGKWAPINVKGSK